MFFIICLRILHIGLMKESVGQLRIPIIKPIAQKENLSELNWRAKMVLWFQTAVQA